ncbi:MAG: hypothetical protein ACYC6N_07540 [Pirellulaceae bacterium]
MFGVGLLAMWCGTRRIHPIRQYRTNIQLPTSNVQG